jgi:rhodanese-related sulfurtransferase
MTYITPSESLTMLNDGQAVLIDVRTPEEFAGEHIPQAISIPLDTLESELSALAENRTRKLIFQCQKGMRGQKACELMMATHPDADIHNLAGGIDGWKHAGLSVLGKQVTPAKLSLMRQVQITFGVLIMLFVSLGYFGVPFSFAITGLLGLGMLISGITGWCGLALLLNKMPWNK